MFKKSTLKKKFTELSVLIFGSPKIGKTTLASFFVDEARKPLFITTEDGTGALEVLEKRVEEWEDFKTLVADLKSKEDKVRKSGSCFVLDLASEIDTMCTNYVCGKYKVSGLGDIGHGKGWDLQGREFQSTINVLLSILPVVFLAHAKDKRVMHQGAEIVVQEPDFAKRAGKFINGKCDLVGFIHPPMKEGSFPELTFKSSLTAQCGGRFPFMAAKNYPLAPSKMKESYLLIKKTFEAGGKNDG